MTPRRLVAAVLTALLVAAGVVGALTGQDRLALAALVVLAGMATAVALDTHRRVSDAAVEARRRGKADAAILKHVARAGRLEQVATAVTGTTQAVGQLETSVTDAFSRTSSAVAETSAAVAAVGESTASLAPTLASLQKSVDKVASGTRSLTKHVTVVQPGMMLTEAQALRQLQARYPTTTPLPAVGRWALNPSGLLWLVDVIERTKPELVVECGSGTSTFWIAAALKSNGKGRVIALEHLAEFATSTRTVIERHGLTEFAEVRHCPLVERETPRGPFQWYDVDAASLGTIDVLLVDGPPGSTGALARYPALPLLGGQLAETSWILVDDAHRKDEQEAVAAWLEADPRLRRHDSAGSASEVLRRG